MALVAAPNSLATPKSYELVNYTGKVADMRFSFGLAQGWPDGSKITTTVADKATKFRLVSRTETEFQFVPLDEKIEKATITLKISGFGEGPSPNRVEGTYSSGGKDAPFTLTKSKK